MCQLPQPDTKISGKIKKKSPFPFNIFQLLNISKILTHPFILMFWVIKTITNILKTVNVSNFASRRAQILHPRFLIIVTPFKSPPTFSLESYANVIATRPSNTTTVLSFNDHLYIHWRLNAFF